MIRHPSSVIVAGPSGSGKSDLTERLLREQKVFQHKPRKIVYCYDRWQPRFERMKRHMLFYKGIPDASLLTKWFGPTKGGVLVLDDLMAEGGQDKQVLDLFTKDSHHRNITVLYLTQDLFPPGKFSKTINRNAHYLIAFKNPRDQTGIRNVLTQAYPADWRDKLDLFKSDCTPLWVFNAGSTPCIRRSLSFLESPDQSRRSTASAYGSIPWPIALGTSPCNENKHVNKGKEKADERLTYRIV